VIPTPARSACALLLLLLATLAPVARAQGFSSNIAPTPIQHAPSAVGVNAATNRAYVVNNGSNSVTVIDGLTAATTVVPTGANPFRVAVNPVTNRIYVTNLGDPVVTAIDGGTNLTTPVTVGINAQSIALNSVTNRIYVGVAPRIMVIDGATNAVVPIDVGDSQAIREIVVNPNTNRIYAAIHVEAGRDVVVVIDGATNKVLASVEVGSFVQSLALNPVTNTIYTSNNASNTVSVIDGSTNTATATLDTGKSPDHIAANVVTNRIYVANAADNSITVIDGATNATTSVPVGTGPNAIAVDSQQNLIYVTNAGGSTVTSIDGATNATTFFNVGSRPVALGVNSVAGKVYVANSGSDDVTIFDCALYVSAPIATGTNPVDVAVNPVTSKAYVANKGSANVTVVEVATGATTTVAAGTSPVAVAADPVTNRIYVANDGSANVTVIDGATNAATTIAVGTNPAAVKVNAVTNKIYVANKGSDSVTVIDGATQATTTVAVGSMPIAVAVNTVTNKVYVANSAGATLTVIDGATAKAIATVTVGANPVDIDINQNTNTVYVANSAAAYASVVDGATDQETGRIPLTGGVLGIAADPATNHVYAISNGANVAVDFDVAHAQSVFIPMPSPSVALAVNPWDHRVYVSRQFSSQVVVLNGATREQGPLETGTGNQPTALAVNNVTGQVYATLSSTNALSMIREPQANPVPLKVSFTPIPGNETTSLTPTLVLSATSTFSPTALPPRAVYLQADSRQGAWIAATATGSGQYSSNALVLKPGFHTIYAYATDGQDATSFQSNVVSYSLLVLESTSPFSALSAEALTFRSLPVNAASEAQSVTLSNGGGAPLTLSDISVAGTNASDFAESDACPATLAVGASCTISVTFTPSVSGPRSASIVVASNTVGGPQSIALGGSGIDLSLAAAASSSLTQTIQAGQTATYSLQLVAAGATNVTDQVSATISCAGAPALATCTAPDAVVIATGETPGTFQISVSTTGALHSASVVPTFRGPLWASANGLSTQSSPATSLGQLGGPALMCSCLVPFGRRRGSCRRSPRPGIHVGWIRAALCMCMLLLPLFGAAFLTGCGSSGNGNGGSTPPPLGQGTPPGTYTLTVSATVGGVAQTAHLTLVVQ